MWYNKPKEVNKKAKTTEQVIESMKTDIDRMTDEKKKIWAEIKDFRVSSNKAQSEYDRMAKLTLAINKLTNQYNKMKRNYE